MSSWSSSPKHSSSITAALISSSLVLFSFAAHTSRNASASTASDMNAHASSASEPCSWFSSFSKRPQIKMNFARNSETTLTRRLTPLLLCSRFLQTELVIPFCQEFVNELDPMKAYKLYSKLLSMIIPRPGPLLFDISNVISTENAPP